MKKGLIIGIVVLWVGWVIAGALVAPALYIVGPLIVGTLLGAWIYFVRMVLGLMVLIQQLSVLFTLTQSLFYSHLIKVRGEAIAVSNLEDTLTRSRGASSEAPSPSFE
jgi:hypothetical protein